MELKQFIKTALSDITSAVAELQAELHNGAIINPDIKSDMVEFNPIFTDGKYRLVKNIRFDVSVSVSESSGKSKKAALSIKVVSADIGKDSNASSEAVSKISFEIPVCLPVAKHSTNLP